MDLHIADTFPVSRETFVFKLFFDDDYNRELHDHLGFRSRSVVETREDDDVLFLKIEFVSGEKLPWAARKLMGDYVGWTEELTFFKREWRLETRMIPNTLAKKVASNATMRFEEPEPGKCTRRADVDVAVKVPLLGGKIANKMAKDITESFRKTAAFTNDYIKRKNLS